MTPTVQQIVERWMRENGYVVLRRSEFCECLLDRPSFMDGCECETPLHCEAFRMRYCHIRECADRTEERCGPWCDGFYPGAWRVEA